MTRAWRVCETCLERLDYNMMGAAASVGIEHAMTTGQVIDSVMSSYHASHDSRSEP